MKMAFLKTNQINRVHWEYSLRIINASIENLHMNEEKIRFIQRIIDALETDDISHFECFVEAISQYDNQTKDGVKDCLQRKMDNLYKVLCIAGPSTIDKSKEPTQEDQKTEKDVTQEQLITKEQLKDYFKPFVYSIPAPGKQLKDGREDTLFEILIEEINEFISGAKVASIYASAVAAKIYTKGMLNEDKVNTFKKWQQIFGKYIGYNLKYKLNQTQGHGEFTNTFTSLK